MTPPVHTVTYVGTTTGQSFPAGQTVGATTATLSLNGVTTAVQNLDTNNTAVFASIPDGSYVLTVQANDASGNALGTPYTVAVLVADQPVTVQIPTGGTVTVQ